MKATSMFLEGFQWEIMSKLKVFYTSAMLLSGKRLENVDYSWIK